MGNGVMEGSAIITPNQMFEEIRTIRDEVRHLSAVVDPALSVIREDIVNMQKDMALNIAECHSTAKGIDMQVRTLENWRWFVLGIAAVFGPGAGYVLSLLFGG